MCVCVYDVVRAFRSDFYRRTADLRRLNRRNKLATRLSTAATDSRGQRSRNKTKRDTKRDKLSGGAFRTVVFFLYSFLPRPLGKKIPPPPPPPPSRRSWFFFFSERLLYYKPADIEGIESSNERGASCAHASSLTRGDA